MLKDAAAKNLNRDFGCRVLKDPGRFFPEFSSFERVGRL